MIEDVLNIIGTFLLAIEAIKLKNIVSFREKYILRIHGVINPKIEWTHDIIAEKDKKSNRLFFTILFIVLVVSGSLSNLLILFRFKGLKTSLECLNNQFFESIIFLVFAFITGMIVWTLFIYVLKYIERVLIKIENNTSNGIVGVLGFILILFSFIIKWTINSTP